MLKGKLQIQFYSILFAKGTKFVKLRSLYNHEANEEENYKVGFTFEWITWHPHALTLTKVDYSLICCPHNKYSRAILLVSKHLNEARKSR